MMREAPNKIKNKPFIQDVYFSNYQIMHLLNIQQLTAVVLYKENEIYKSCLQMNGNNMPPDGKLYELTQSTSNSICNQNLESRPYLQIL